MKKRCCSILLATALLLTTLLSVTSWAAGTAPTDGADLYEAETEWTAAEAGAALQLDLGEDTLINRVRLNETSRAVQTFHIEVWNGESWENVYDNDYILTDRDCILPEDVTTSAVRLVVDSLKGEATIDRFSADYQASSENAGFMNVGYASDQWYEKGWSGFASTEEQLNSMTDLIMINNFNFDTTGHFVITQNGTSYPYDSQQADQLMKKWTDRLKGASSHLAEGKTRLWFSITKLNNNAGHSTIFLDEETRRTFAKEVVAFALRHNFYGVDVDWEYPDGGDANLVAFHRFLATLSEELHRVGLKLSSTVCPNYKNFLDTAEYKVLDYVSWMTYTNVTNDGNVLAQVPFEHMKNLIQDSINRGCRPEQIWIGLPYFGRPSGESAATFSDLYNTYMRANPGKPFPKGLNVIDMSDNKGKIYRYCYNGAYLIEDKVAFAAETGCAGMMSWWSGQDIKSFGEDSLCHATYAAIKRFTGVDTLDPEKTDWPADYQKVRAALGQVPDDLDNYTADSAAAVTAAVEAVEWGLPVSRQADVDAMADAIEKAVSALVAVSRMPGDVDGDKEVKVSDALEALRAAVGLNTLTGDDLWAADMDHSGNVDVTDALQILRIAVGLA